MKITFTEKNLKNLLNFTQAVRLGLESLKPVKTRKPIKTRKPKIKKQKTKSESEKTRKLKKHYVSHLTHVKM